MALLLCVLLGVLGMGKVEGAEGREGAVAQGRGFAMGFSAFPHDMSLAALAEVREAISRHGDMVEVHLEHVPWDEALAGEAFAPAMMADWEGKRAMRPAGGKLYLALTPLDLGRRGLAQHRGAKEGESLSAAFAGKAMGSPEVKKAYLAYCRRAVEFYRPNYLCIGIEVNELFHNTRGAWAGYAELHRATYAALKKEYPELPIFVSFTLHNALNPAWADREAMRKAFEELMPQNDAVAISFYPFMAGLSGREGEALAWVDKTFGQYQKPFAVAETGELGADVKLTGMTLRGTPARQEKYVRELLAYARGRKTLFVTWFLYRDYDALWEKIRGFSPEAFVVWMHCGLVDAKGEARPALQTWDGVMKGK